MPAKGFFTQTGPYSDGTHINLKEDSRGSNMNPVLQLAVLLLLSLVNRVGSIAPSGGYCINNQCFAVFRDLNDFSRAQNECRDQEGQLMTVRSSVEHDVLSVLLGNFKGSFWIGLHRPLRCPDPVARLRGYEWVTKDDESDFSNWLPDFNMNCSSQRCVSVSPELDFRWSQKPCQDQAAGFLCEYTSVGMCQSQEESPGETVMYTTPYGFVVRDLLSAPPGSTALRMPSETKYLCYAEMWQPAPWNCEMDEGGCEYKCTESPNKMPSCYCPPGKTLNPANKVTCEQQLVGDPCLALSCEQICYMNGDSYACMCDRGFQLADDGRSCVDFNDCNDPRQCPGENSVCVNKPGGFECICKAGYSTRNGQCVDVNECVSGPCEHECHNTHGSYKCSCYDGYRVDPKSANKCKLFCGKEECPAECDPNNNFQCYCPDGYVVEERVDSTVCIDMDECSDLYCEQKCQNTFGSYVCFCSLGYVLVDGYKCVESDDDSSEGTSAPDTPTTVSVPYPDPTRQPSGGVPPGGLVGIIIFTAVFIVLVVFLADRAIRRRAKRTNSIALKAEEGEDHGFHQVKAES